MQVKTSSKKDSTARITPTMPWRLKTVEPLPGYRLHVKFMDDLEGEVDMAQLIQSEKAGVFSQLKDQNIFNQVHLEYGVVTWPGEVDLAPDAMYAAIKKNGKCTLI